MSVAIEHVIPESLGNTKLTLPKGTVCDRCNNYFATHIEQPILQSNEFLYLRFNQELKNKRRKVPAAKVIFGDQVVNARRLGSLSFSFDSEDFAKIEAYLAAGGDKMMIPVSGTPPDDTLTSRWLAKMGLEMLAHRWQNIDRWNDYIVEHAGLDEVRRYARAPKPGEKWDYGKRRIYEQNSSISTPDGQSAQMIYECDILATGTEESSEFYFVVAIFGVEYSINLGGNSMDGYYVSGSAGPSPDADFSNA
ncbi:hypothetical protein JCM10599A_20060 [Paraburkholderia kururiensis]